MPRQDMAPKYMVDKSFGKSLYSSDFDGEKVCMCKPYMYVTIRPNLLHAEL